MAINPSNGQSPHLFRRHMIYNRAMHYVVGLGNPGEQYANTRHNIGWLALDFVREQNNLPPLIESGAATGFLTEGMIGTRPVKLLYPTTFMNNAGSAVAKLVPKNEVGNLVIVQDDIALPFGEVKLSQGRGDGGHNGIKSIIEKLGGKDFIRIRIGIAPTSILTGKVKRPAGGGPLERFVLKPFSQKESVKLGDINKKVNEALIEILVVGIEAAMNRFN